MNTSPPAFTQEARLFIYFFCFPAQKFGLCFFNHVTTKTLSNEQVNSTQNTYTSFTNVASGCAKRLPSDRPTELNKPQTNVFYLRDESNLTNALFLFFHCTLCATCLTDQGKSQDQSWIYDLLRATFPDAWHRLTTLLRVLIGSGECTEICSDWPDYVLCLWFHETPLKNWLWRKQLLQLLRVDGRCMQVYSFDA